MSAISILNPKAEFARAQQTLAINVSAAKEISEIMKSNLEPKGVMKMLVSGSGDIKITKDGNVLLHDMQIQHPTASLIAKASTAHDDVVGDRAASIVLLIGGIMKLAEPISNDGCPRLITDGLDIAKKKALALLESMRIPTQMKRCFLTEIARSSHRTKVHQKLADHMAENWKYLNSNKILRKLQGGWWSVLLLVLLMVVRIEGCILDAPCSSCLANGTSCLFVIFDDFEGCFSSSSSPYYAKEILRSPLFCPAMDEPKTEEKQKTEEAVGGGSGGASSNNNNNSYDDGNNNNSSSSSSSSSRSNDDVSEDDDVDESGGSSSSIIIISVICGIVATVGLIIIMTIIIKKKKGRKYSVFENELYADSMNATMEKNHAIPNIYEVI